MARKRPSLDLNQGALCSLQTRVRDNIEQSEFLKVKFGHTSEVISEKVQGNLRVTAVVCRGQVCLLRVLRDKSQRSGLLLCWE